MVNVNFSRSRLLAQGKALPKKIRSLGYSVFLFKFAGQTFGTFVSMFFFSNIIKRIVIFIVNINRLVNVRFGQMYNSKRCNVSNFCTSILYIDNVYYIYKIKHRQHRPVIFYH
ncbi:hypothetical protein QTP88_008476 [Uroleucon formosanum]